MIRAAALLIAVLVVGCGSSTGSTGGGSGGSGGSAGGGSGGSAGGGSGGGGAGGGSGGGTGGSGGSGGGTSSADQACTAYASALCNRVNVCIPFGTETFYGDVATCIARYKLSCVPALGLPTSGATPAKLNTCATSLMTASCTSIRESTAGCRYMGTQAAGTACGANSQCVSAYCKPTTAACGVCTTRVANGGNCTATDDCPDYSACVNTVCKAKGVMGAGCSSNAPCGDGLWCKLGTCAAAGTTVGAPCDALDFDSCDYLSGKYCQNSDVCGQITFAAPGAPCGLTTTSLVLCSFSGTCKLNGSNGTCVAAAADGAACDASAGLNCVDPAICVSGVCRVPNPATCL